MSREPDVSSSPLGEPGASPRFRIKRRWWIRTIWLVGFLTPFVLLLWRLFGPPERIVVSYETTRITSPLKADGRSVDFGAALRLQFQSQKAVPFSDTPVAELMRRRAKERPSENGAVPTFYAPEIFLSQDYIVSQQDSDRFRDRCYGQLPIAAESDPELAEIIESNMPWYKAVMQQHVIETTLSLEALEIEEEEPSNPVPNDAGYERNAARDSRELARRIGQLARYEFGRGRPEQGIDALEWSLQWNRAMGVRTAPLTDSLSVVSADTTSQETLITLLLNQKKIDERQLARICTWEIHADLHLRQAAAMDTFERYGLLNAIQNAQRDFEESGLMIGSFFDENAKQRWIRNSIRWNAVFETQNQYLDRICNGMTIGNFPDRIKQLEKQREPYRDEFDVDGYGADGYELKHLLFKDWTNWLQAACFNRSDYSRSAAAVPAADLNRQRALNLVARLVTWRQRFGEYPENLNELLTLKDFPQPPEHLTIDAFTIEPFRYLRTVDGFVISSAGPNMVHEIKWAAQSTDEPRKHDDRFWSWPRIN